MTTPAPSSSPPIPAPYTPAWMLYVYDQRAFLTFDGRLIATAMVKTPAQESRFEGVFHRLDQGQAARRSAQATCLALERRP